MKCTQSNCDKEATETYYFNPYSFCATVLKSKRCYRHRPIDFLYFDTKEEAEQALVERLL